MRVRVAPEAHLLPGRACPRHSAVPASPAPHPHIGALDLVPVHPMPGTAATLPDAARCAEAVARRLGEALGQPVLLYGAAHATGRALAAVRRRTTFFAPDWQRRDVGAGCSLRATTLHGFGLGD